MDINQDRYAKTESHWPIYVRKEHLDEARAGGGSVQVFPAGAATALAEASGRKMGRTVGYTGVPLSGGEIDLDANPCLSPTEWRGSYDQIGIVDRMVREDPVAQAIRMAWTLPLLSVPWTVEAASDDEKDIEIADFVQAALFEHLQGGFEQFLEQAVQFTWRGWSLFEIVARYDKTLERTVIDRLAPRLPWTVYEWLRYSGNRWGCRQYGYSGDGLVGTSGSFSSVMPLLPPEKLLHFTYQPDGDNPEPMGILRPAYGAWRQRATYLKLEATGYERAAYGIPYVEVDVNASPGDVEQVNVILRELRAGIRAFAMFPRGYTLKFADFPMKGVDIREARIAAGQDMARAALCQFLFTGEQAGSYSLIRGQLDHYSAALQQAANRIAATLSQGKDSLIKRLVNWNFQGVQKYPVLQAGEVRVGDPKQLVEAIRTATDGGIIIPDSNIEAKVRMVLALPAKEERMAPEGEVGVEAPPGPPGTADKAADTALNGAQVTAALEIVALVNAGGLPVEAGLGMLQAFFNLSRAQAELVMGTGDPLAVAPPAAATPPEPPKGSPAPSGEDSERGDAQVEQEEEVVAHEHGPGCGHVHLLAEFPPERLDGDRIVMGPLGRDVRPLETVVRYSETRGGTTDLSRSLGVVISQWRDSIADEYAKAVSKAPTLAAAMDVEVPGKEQLAAALRSALQDAYDQGKGSVDAEQKRQEEDPELRDAIAEGDVERTEDDIEVTSDQPRLPFALAVEKPELAPGVVPTPIDAADPEEVIESVVATTVKASTQRIEDATITALQNAGVGGTMPEAAVASTVVADALKLLSPGKDEVAAARDVKSIFGLGRVQEQRALGTQRFMYSNLTESETCEPCASHDGETFGLDELATYATPAAWCLGYSNCNCIVIGIAP